MKSAIESHAVSVSMRWEGDQWNPTAYWKPSTYAYYYNGTAGTNHLVAVVGWDDSFPASNFSTTPAGNGAWLVKNSWGTGWGDGGLLLALLLRHARRENVPELGFLCRPPV